MRVVRALLAATVFATAVAVVVSVAPPALAAGEPTGVLYGPDPVVEDGTVSVSGVGHPAGADVTVTVNGLDFGSTTVDDDGQFHHSFTMEWPRGTYPIVITVGGVAYTGTITVVGPTGAFADDDGSVHEAAIEALSAAGVVAGCSTDAFCPDQPVTRAQLASFVDRLVPLPPAEQDFFTDDDGSVHEPAIDRLATNGATAGCAPSRYCPADPVTRAQVASFLGRLLALPETGTDHFTDDEGSVHEHFIDRLAEAGVTAGCAPERYCPRAPVTRGQLASLLVRAFDVAAASAHRRALTDIDGSGDVEPVAADPTLAPGQATERDDDGQVGLDGVDVGTKGGGALAGVCDIEPDTENEVVVTDPGIAPGQLLTRDLAADADQDVDVVWYGTAGGGTVVAMVDLDSDGDCDTVLLDPVVAIGQSIRRQVDAAPDTDWDVIWIGADGGATGAATFAELRDVDQDGEVEVVLDDPGDPAVPITIDFDGDGNVDVQYE